jgi:hypothetical protein
MEFVDDPREFELCFPKILVGSCTHKTGIDFRLARSPMIKQREKQFQAELAPVDVSAWMIKPYVFAVRYPRSEPDVL